MYRIGEFSYLCHVTIKTLYHYEKIGLVKPKKIDQLTGYRYYDAEQIEQVKSIKELQSTGFSLKEIADILQHQTTEMLSKKQEEIKKTSSKQIQQIHKMKEKIKNKTVEVISNPDFYFVGQFKIMDRKDLATFDFQEGFLGYHENHWALACINLEESYETKQMKCFVGKLISREEEPEFLNYLYSLKNHAKKKELPNIFHETIYKKYLHVSNTNIEDAYHDIISFANQHHYILDGGFIEIQNNDKIDVYKAFIDTTEINEDHQRYFHEHLSKLKNIHEKKYVGKWLLQGEMVWCYQNVFKDGKIRKVNDDTTLLILYEDGTTNLDNVMWKEDYLIKNNNNYIHMHYGKKGLQKYLTLLIPTADVDPIYCNISKRYLYKKIK